MTPSDPQPDFIDIEGLELGAMARYARTATFAPNWKAVLAADALVGVMTVLAGVAAVVWLHWTGWFLVAVGVVYVALVGRRFLQWRWLRRRAGL